MATGGDYPTSLDYEESNHLHGLELDAGEHQLGESTLFEEDLYPDAPLGSYEDDDGRGAAVPGHRYASYSREVPDHEGEVGGEVGSYQDEDRLLNPPSLPPGLESLSLLSDHYSPSDPANDGDLAAGGAEESSPRSAGEESTPDEDTTRKDRQTSPEQSAYLVSVLCSSLCGMLREVRFSV